MNLIAAGSAETSLLFVELGLIVIGLAVLARISTKFNVTSIPLYLLAGLAFGEGGLAPLTVTKDFIRTGSEVGVVLLMFMLGLEYPGQKLVRSLRTGMRSGVIDFVFNFLPGLLVGFALKMSPIVSVLLGGVTYVSSSGVIAKVLGEAKGNSSKERNLVIRILVLEDLAMAVYLPIVAVLVAGRPLQETLLSVGIAVGTVFAILFAAVRFSKKLSKLVSHECDEVLLLTTLGLVLFVSGIASSIQISSAVGAFLVGVASSGPLAERVGRLIAPLRDLFVATFFLFFGLQINPATLPSALPVALGLAILTALTKVASSYLSARKEGFSKEAGVRVGMTLIPRGEFSVVVAGLGVTLDPRLGTIAAAYVLFLAVLGSVLAKVYGVQPSPEAVQ